MKKNRSFLIYLILFVSLLLGCGISQALEWHQLSVGKHSDLNGLHFLSSTFGFAVSKSGDIYRIQKSNNSWEIDTTKFKSVFEGIHFLEDGSRGFAYGTQGHILMTLDTGRTWKVDTLGPRYCFYDLKFIDEKNGFAVGSNFALRSSENGIVYHTKNGGESWDSVAVRGYKLINIERLGTDGIYITGKKHALYSSDRGVSWSEIPIDPKISPRGCSFTEPYGLMAGMGGHIGRTEDAGQTWKDINIFSNSMTFFDILMLDSDQAYIAGIKGELYYTDDGGQNWIPEASTSPSDFSEFQIVGNRIFVAGSQGLIVYADLK